MSRSRIQHVFEESHCRVAAVLAVAMCCLAAAKAQATCGDYLHSRGAPMANLPSGGGLEPPVEGVRPESTPTRRPCQGLSCERQFPIPVPVSPAPRTQRAETLGIVAAEPTLSTSGSSQLVDPEECGSISGYPLRVRRPPRV
jgi:hypothetical protein